MNPRAANASICVFRGVPERNDAEAECMRARFRQQSGVTLLELTFAMAVFAIALGATMRILTSYYVSLDVQERRSTAIQHCRSVMSAIRQVRDQSGPDFVAKVPQWVDEQQSGGDTPFADLFDSMDGEVVSVTCQDLLTGGAPADPMLVTVTSAFEDMLGRPVTVETSTILTRQD